jgi:hypothetical protein
VLHPLLSGFIMKGTKSRARSFLNNPQCLTDQASIDPEGR